MEPGHEDREYFGTATASGIVKTSPQWSPVMKTGNTGGADVLIGGTMQPQWSPVMKTGNTP